jgi:acetolactate synthase-1/2/3 large subunit
VINFQSDGCGAYSVQAFWTQARENLDVVTIIGSNRSYEILELELLRAGVAQTGPMARSMLRLDNPLLNWVKIGEGFGVPSQCRGPRTGIGEGPDAQRTPLN